MRRFFISFALIITSCSGGCDFGCGADPSSRVRAIAKCGEKQGDVRSHPAESTTWDPLTVGAELAAGDWVQTAADAWARIQFFSGSELRVEPATVVVLEDPTADDAKDSGGLISLRSGTVRGSAKRSMTVRTPSGKRVRIAPASGSDDVGYKLSADHAGAVSLAVTKGRAMVRGDDGVEVSMAEGQAHRVKGGILVGSVVVLPSPPTLRSPAPQAGVTAAANEAVELAWEGAQTKGTTYRVQVATDETFSAVVADQVVDRSSLSFRPSKPGRFYWRVASRTQEGLESDFGAPRHFDLKEAVPDLLEEPADGALIAFRRRKPWVTFKWKTPSDANRFEIVVAKDADLDTDVVLRLPAEGGGAKTRALGPGTYYWGVFSIRGADRDPLFPRPRRLVLKRGRKGIKLPRRLKWE